MTTLWIMTVCSLLLGGLLFKIGVDLWKEEKMGALVFILLSIIFWAFYLVTALRLLGW